MQDTFQYWKDELSLIWQHLCWLAPRIRGIVRDHAGRWYWYLEDQYQVGQMKLTLFPFPGLTDRGHFGNQAGWVAIGRRTADNPSLWMLFDVRVPPRYRGRGLGTLLVWAAIRVARQSAARELHGIVTLDDAREHPFLPEWYARLGFVVSPRPLPNPLPLIGGGLCVVATLRMDLDK